MGLSYGAMKQRNPRIVLTSISNFGQNGPYSEYEASEVVYYAMSGLMNVTGLQSREPVKVGAHIIQFHAGIMSALHSMIALGARRREAWASMWTSPYKRCRQGA